MCSVNDEAKKCKATMIVSDKLWSMCEFVAFKRLRQLNIPFDEHMSWGFSSIYRALRTWDQKNDFLLKVWSCCGAESEEYRNSLKIVQSPSRATLKRDEINRKERVGSHVTYVSDFVTEEGVEFEAMYGHEDPNVFSTDSVDIVLSQLEEDDKELLDKMLSIEYERYTSKDIAKEYGISKQALHMRYNKLKKKMRHMKKIIDERL